MNIHPEHLYLFLAMGAVTYIPRWLPLSVLSRRQLPPWLLEWLDLIPVSILSALVLPELVLSTPGRQLDLNRPEMWVAIPTLAFAVKTKSLGGTVLVGMFLYWVAGTWI